MSLIGQYQTLLRRGMPEHPNLSYEDCGTYGDGSKDMRWVQNPSGIAAYDEDDPLFHPELDDARDLITMHAARWAADNGIYFIQTESGWHPVETIELSEYSAKGVPEYERGEDDLLAVVIKATAHLGKGRVGG